jgi:endonuclease/exonuclease/phosphatase family metal-dependent hydrolase
MPALISLNILFAVYWGIRFKIQFLLSLIVLLIGFTHLSSLMRISFQEGPKDKQAFSTLSILSYNVRLFNKFEWIEDRDIKTEIIDFVENEDPDIFLAQEFMEATADDFNYFKFHHIYQNDDGDPGQAIFTNQKIVNKGIIDFQNSANRAIYADILFNNDTIRVFNLHLESLKIESKVEELRKEDGKKLISRVGHSFVLQQRQTKKMLVKMKATPYKIILGGDFNNSAFSYVYRQLSNDLKDSFKEAGQGFGRTFVFDFIPIRIDFLLVDPGFEVLSFKNYDIQLSDHYPIKAELGLKN